MDKRRFIMAVFLFTLVVVFMIGAIIFSAAYSKKSVSISTSPVNAHYKIDSLEGTAPATLKLKPGDYQIELSSKNYETLKQTLVVKPFQKNLLLSYALKFDFPLRPSKEAVTKDFGGTPPNPDWKQKAENLKIKYALFYDKLPYRGLNFYISPPTQDDKFFIYVPAADPEDGKQATLDWFRQNGITDPNSLNIVWQYR